MKAIVCHEFGPIESLTLETLSDPQPGKGEALVSIIAAGVNFPDGLVVAGKYQMQPERPFVPGAEFCGEVKAVGEGVTNVQPGDRVVSFSMTGAFAEQVVASAAHLIPVPDGVASEEAAGLLTAHATAHHALKQRAALQSGETLLVTGAAGGTGMAAVQIGKAMGARVIAVCSSPEKLEVAKAQGADELINYQTQDLKQEIKRITEGKGVDVVYDVVGGDTFDILARSMAWQGRLLVIGFASGKIPQMPINLALVKCFSLVGVFWGNFTLRHPKVFAENMAELFAWYQSGEVKVVIDEVFPLEQTVQALNKVMGRSVIGKVIIKNQ